MIITDKVYGKVEVNEPVLLQLINSKAIQRLKGIEQYGLPKTTFGFGDYTRYDHSVGVMILLKILGASLEEQIAGLIHDISHTAFSHVIDRAIGDTLSEDFQDNAFEKFLKNSDIPKILKKHKYDVSDFLNLHKFPLLEQPAPHLCADRIDYILREMKEWIEGDKVEFLLNQFTIYNDRIAFDDKKAATIFATTYMTIQKKHWINTDVLVQDEVFSGMLREALKKKTITMNDMFTTDKEVIKKLKKAGYSEMFDTSGKLRKHKFEISENGKVHLLKKFRHVDPEIFEDGQVKKLSQLDASFRDLLKDEEQRIKKGIRVDIIDYK